MQLVHRSFYETKVPKILTSMVSDHRKKFNKFLKKTLDFNFHRQDLDKKVKSLRTWKKLKPLTVEFLQTWLTKADPELKIDLIAAPSIKHDGNFHSYV